MKLFSIEGNRQWLDGGAMFGNAPRTMWQKWVTPDAQNRIPLACRSLLIDTGKVRVLFELGIGLFFEPDLRLRYGVEGSENLLLKNLNIMGYSESDIDYVIPSHLHFDHVGGLIPDWPATKNENWELRFPKAKYIIGNRQWQHALKPHKRDRVSYINGVTDKLQKSGRMQLIDEKNFTLDSNLSNWLQFRFSEGHTPGLMLAVIKGKSETMIFCSDLVPGIHWVPASISMGYDRFAEKSLDEKEELLKEAIDKNYLFFYTHDADCAVSRVALSDKGKYFAVGIVKELIGYEF